MAKNGLHLITPTSIAYTGTSASPSANGSVTFSACSALSLNGVFSADYDNYMIVCRQTSGSATNDTRFRLRASGVDESSASNYYTYQYLNASSTTVFAGRGSTTSALFLFSSGAGSIGGVMNIYGPHLAQPTALRTVGAGTDGGNIMTADRANTHSLSNSYDGFTMFVDSNSISGRIAVYGMRK